MACVTVKQDTVHIVHPAKAIHQAIVYTISDVPRSKLRPSSPSSSRHVLILLSDELLGHLDLLSIPPDVEQLLVLAGLSSSVQLHVGPRLDLDLPYGVSSW